MTIAGTWFNGQTCAPSPCAATLVRACPADFDHSGHADMLDVLTFLSAWFDLDPRADMHADGEIEATDVFDFLTAWFAGC